MDEQFVGQACIIVAAASGHLWMVNRGGRVEYICVVWVIARVHLGRAFSSGNITVVQDVSYIIM